MATDPMMKLQEGAKALLELLKGLLIAVANVLLLAFQHYYKVLRGVPVRRVGTGDVVLVTGGGGGIGLATAIAFAKKGASVVIWDIKQDLLDEAEKQIVPFAYRFFKYNVDVSNREQVYATAERMKEDLAEVGGRVTILVNNAGVAKHHRLLEANDESIEKTYAVNVLGYVWTLKAFVPEMIRNNNGHIVSIASVQGFAGTPNLADYASTKAAIWQMMSVFRRELAADGVTGVKTSIVHPSFVLSGMWTGEARPWGLFPLATPADIAEKVVRAVEFEIEQAFDPWLSHFTPMLSILPQQAFDRLCRFTEESTVDTSTVVYGRGGY